MEDLTLSPKAFLSSFKSKQVLPMWEYTKFVVVPVDEPSGCKNQHILNRGFWHRYYDAKGQLYGVRCPALMTHDEKSRVVLDDPPGSWELAVAGRRDERLRAEAAKKLAEKREPKTWGNR